MYTPQHDYANCCMQGKIPGTDPTALLGRYRDIVVAHNELSATTLPIKKILNADIATYVACHVRDEVHKEKSQGLTLLY